MLTVYKPVKCYKMSSRCSRITITTRLITQYIYIYYHLSENFYNYYSSGFVANRRNAETYLTDITDIAQLQLHSSSNNL